MTRILTPSLIYAAQAAIENPPHPLTDSFFVALSRQHTHEVLDEHVTSTVATKTIKSRPIVAVTARFMMRPGTIGPIQVLTLDVPESMAGLIVDGEPGQIVGREHTDREIVDGRHLWPSWPRCPMIHPVGRRALIDGGWRDVPAHGWLAADGPRTKIRLHLDKDRSLDFKDVGALLAAGWRPRMHPVATYGASVVARHLRVVG